MSVTALRPVTATSWLLRIVGAGLLVAMGWIHLDLWLAGYRHVDVIGPAFLLDVVAGFGLAVLVLLVPLRFLTGIAGLGAVVSAAALTALLLSTTIGLFGFTESTAAMLWWETFWVELAAVAVLTTLAVLAARRR